MEGAGAGIGHVNHDVQKLEVIQELGGGGTASLDAHGDDTASTLGQVLLGQIVLGVTFQQGVVHPIHALVGGEELGHGQSVGAVALHAESQGLQTEVEQECGHGGHGVAHVAEHLHSCLGDVGGGAEGLGVDHAVVGVVGGGQLGIAAAHRPVELTAVHDTAAHHGGVAVHVLGGGVGDDITAVLEGTAEDGRGEGVVHHQGHIVLVRQLGVSFDIEDHQGGVGHGLTEEQTGVLVHHGLDLSIGHVGGGESHLNAHLLQSDGEKVDGTAVDGGQGDDVLTGGGDVQHGGEVGGLTRGDQHGANASLHLGNLGLHAGEGGVGDAGVHVAVGLQVKEVAQVVGGIVLVGGALVDGQGAGLAVLGLVAALYADGIKLVVGHGFYLLF